MIIKTLSKLIMCHLKKKRHVQDVKMIIFYITVIFTDKLHRTKPIQQADSEQFLPCHRSITPCYRVVEPTYRKQLLLVVERGSARRFSLKGWERTIMNQKNTGTVSKATLGKLPRDGVERIWAFPSAHVPSCWAWERNQVNCCHRQGVNFAGADSVRQARNERQKAKQNLTTVQNDSLEGRSCWWGWIDSADALRWPYDRRLGGPWLLWETCPVEKRQYRENGPKPGADRLAGCVSCQS